MIKYLKEEKLEDLTKDKKVIVNFYADWCMPCQMLGKVTEELQNEIEIVKINVDEHQDIAESFKVMTVPTLLLYDNNEIVKKTAGYMEKEDLLNWYNN